MTRDESIKLASELSKKYQNNEQIRAQITDYEARIERPIEFDIKHYTVFDFFKKYLAASFIVTFVLSIPTFMFCAVCEFLYKSGNTEYANSHINGMLFLVGVFALIHLIGGFVARKKTKANNDATDYALRANIRLKQSLKKDVMELEELLFKSQEDLEKYNDMIPSGLRDSSSMNRLKAVLLASKAEDFADGISYLQGGRHA